MQQDPPLGVTSTKLFEDKTPNRVILSRVLLNSIEIAQGTDLSNEDGSDVIDLVVLLSRKLLSVWLHQQAYQREQDSIAHRCVEWPVTQREHSQELYEEFDVLSVQVKSTLDHSVQIMRPILGRNKWSMRTFSAKGESVLNSLKRNTSKHHACHVRLMERYLFNDVNKHWIASIIDERDRVNHGLAGGLKIERFVIFKDDKAVVHLPMWNDKQPLAEVMALAWENLFRYVEDFVALALNFRLKDEFSLVRHERPLTSPAPSWQRISREAADDFVKAHPQTRTI